jgi:hypothetical protein
VAATLLKAIVGAEISDEERHPIVTKDDNSADNVTARVTMWRRDTINLRHEELIADETLLSLEAILVDL